MILDRSTGRTAPQIKIRLSIAAMQEMKRIAIANRMTPTALVRRAWFRWFKRERKPERLLVYVAGAIGKERAAIPDNVRRSEAAAMELTRLGYSVFLPHACCHWPGASESDINGSIRWYDVVLPWVEVCDLIVRLDGVSAGSDGEVARAHELGIPVKTMDEIREEHRNGTA